MYTCEVVQNQQITTTKTDGLNIVKNLIVLVKA